MQSKNIRPSDLMSAELVIPANKRVKKAFVSSVKGHFSAQEATAESRHPPTPPSARILT